MKLRILAENESATVSGGAVIYDENGLVQTSSNPAMLNAQDSNWGNPGATGPSWMQGGNVGEPPLQSVFPSPITVVAPLVILGIDWVLGKTAGVPGVGNPMGN